MIISIVNHKGGTGKTTTTINLGSALAQLGHSVLVVDFDAQGSLTYSLGISDDAASIADMLHGDKSAEEVIQERESMHVVPANARLADIELAIAKSSERYNHLANLLASLPAYDFILIDCPPSLSLLTLNALVASSKVLVPMQMDVLALRGLDSMLETIQKVHSLNSNLKVLGVLPMMMDARKNIHQEVLTHIRSNYAVHIFKQPIRACVKAAEAPSFGKSVVHYAPTSATASDYRELAAEIVKISSSTTKELQTIN
jgi:chromosome partitioning protein